MSVKTGFHRYLLPERVLEQLPAIGYKRPTRVQEKVIPLFLQKRNLIVEAPTGTGKTAAYALPLIARLNLQKRSTQALVLAPSRELAIQIAKAIGSYHEEGFLRVEAVYGGVPMSESFAAIKSAPHILVAVPGRLKDVMAHYRYDFLWRDIKFLIVDEADKLLETGFQKDFDNLRQHVRSRAQVGFFSATISRDSEALIRERFRKIETVRLSPREMLKNIRFAYIEVPEGKRAIYLAGLLEQEKVTHALIFCGRREEVHSVTGFLRNCGYKAEAYYGLQDQAERENILKRFREGHIQYLVASDLAARGLDIPDLPAVINLSISEEFDFYLHRVGRTGRAGNKGRVYNLIQGSREAAFMQNHHNKIQLPVRACTIREPDSDKLKSPLAQKWVKVHFSRGKKDKIRKGDIAGFLINHAAVEMDKIGTITLYDQYTIVDVPEKAISRLEDETKTLKIKGKTVKVRKYRQAELEKKAQAIRKLKKDRKP